MPRFRKKPVVIEAEQWFPGKYNIDSVREDFHQTADGERLPNLGYIETLEGRMTVSPGDWVITGVKGEKYPCKPDIFEATYEPAEAATPERLSEAKPPPARDPSATTSADTASQRSSWPKPRY